MRRLTKSQYDNTVGDLLGTTLTPSSDFLNDGPKRGFDNNADLQSLPPAQVELYVKAAERLAEETLAGASRSSIVSCDLAAGDDCFRSIITSFGGRAYRRPLSPSEISSLLTLATSARVAGASPEETLRTLLVAMLSAPQFLFLVEAEAEPAPTVRAPLGEFETASRLSYMLYGSMPDQPLFAAASAGILQDTEQIRAQVTRMLADPKSQRAARTFVEQWLGAGLVDDFQPEPTLFPNWDPQLNASMNQELTSFYGDLLANNRPATELLTADFTYLDDRLAAHYGLPAVGGGFQRVQLHSDQRGGLLGMATPLIATSYPTRTSVVKRGAFVLAEYLCAEPPPPPPGIVPLPPDLRGFTGSQRELVAAHRTSPACAACHEQMDNIGIALENYDATAAWRTSDRGAPIDARGELPGGTTFDGPRQLATALAKDERLLPCLTGRLMTYSLGRRLTDDDASYVSDILAAAPEAGLRDLLVGIALSEPLRMRNPAPSTPEEGTP